MVSMRHLSLRRERQTLILVSVLEPGWRLGMRVHRDVRRAGHDCEHAGDQFQRGTRECRRVADGGAVPDHPEQ